MADNKNDEYEAQQAALREEQDRQYAESTRQLQDQQAAVTMASSNNQSNVSSKQTSAESSSKEDADRGSYISANADTTFKNNMNKASSSAQKTVNDSKSGKGVSSKEDGVVNPLDALGVGGKAFVFAQAIQNLCISAQMRRLSAILNKQPDHNLSPTSMEYNIQKYAKQSAEFKMKALKVVQTISQFIGASITGAGRTISSHSRSKNVVTLAGAKGRTDGASRSSFADVSAMGTIDRELPFISIEDDTCGDVQPEC